MDLAEVSRGGAASGQAIHQSHRWEHTQALPQAWDDSFFWAALFAAGLSKGDES